MKSFVIRFPWTRQEKDSPQESRKRERRKARREAKRRLREQEGKK